MSSQPKAGPSKRAAKSKRNHAISSSRARQAQENQKLETLEREVAEFTPTDSLKTFAALPLSDGTKRGLKKAYFVNTTDIQAKSIPLSLKGKDVLGSARTGSGKTLAFLVPVLDILHRRKWGPTDGLGALIISPTRELAVQIFEVLRSIGGYHSFSAGLVIGGKNLKDESDRLARMNILVATPGRLLQHMDQTFGFDADNLQVLVLDEADRILDMGFSKTLSAILSHLPKSRQTLLFSATQTQSVKDLARLSLKDPIYVGVNDQSAEASTATSTPENLSQHYLTCTLDQKLSVLWSFIKSHLQSKVLVFLSSCKQVRFVYETFSKMRPGISLIHMHGKQKQSARLTMYNKFITSKHSVLIATDIAARGLDFPSVDWVLQVDAPEDADTYIHRVGRTARYESKGKSLLFLMPSEEEGMLAALQAKSIKIEKLKVRSSKTQSIENQLQNLAFQDPEIKYLGQRAFVSYLRSVHLHKDKSIFKVADLPIEEFAESLGLPGAPKIKFLSKEMAKQKKNANHKAAKAVQEAAGEDKEDSDDGEEHSSSEEEDEEPTAPAKSDVVRTKYDRMFGRKNQDVLTEHYDKLIDRDDDDKADDDDDFMTIKRADHELPEEHTGTLYDINVDNLSNRKAKLGNVKKIMILNAPTTKKLVFGDDGEARLANPVAEDAERWVQERGGIEGVMKEGIKYAETGRGMMKIVDVVDKEEARDKRREKKRKRKDRERGLADQDGEMGPMIASVEDDGYVSPDFDIPDADSDEDDDESPPPHKKPRIFQGGEKKKHSIEDDEEMALQLLRGGT